MTRLALAVALGATLTAAACAPRAVSLPGDAGAAWPAAADVLRDVTAACRGVTTLTAELALSGRVGEQRLRGRVHAGFAAPAAMRLEGVAPFGPPAFILAARAETATLLMPRDDRVVTGEPPDALLGALTGVPWSPDDVRAVVSGCVTAAPVATGGRLHQDGWASIDLDGGARMYLRQRAGAWRVVAATRGAWRVDYTLWEGRFPGAFRLRSDADAVRVDLSASTSQLETNLPIDPAAFVVDVPPGAEAMTLAELRRLGPLRGTP